MTAREAREALGVGLEELARWTGVKPRSILRYESNGGAGERTARILAQALGIPAQCYMVGAKYPADRISSDFRATTREATAIGHRREKKG